MAQLENFRLKVFRTVADRLNFRKAAEQLLLTQPAVTLQIQALENDLGVRLFDRTAGRITLTRQGAILRDYANRLAALVAAAESELGAGETEVSGELSFGVSTTIAQYVLPRLLQAFLAEHPRVQFLLRSGNTSEIVQLLLEDKISIGLIEGPARDRGLRSEPFMEDEIVLITKREFPLERLSRPQLLACTLLMREQGSGSRRVVEHALEKARCKLKAFRKVIDLDSTEAIKSAVEVGLGVGFVSRWAVAKELELNTLKVAQVAGLHILRSFSLITSAGPEPKGPSGVLRSFTLARARQLSSATPGSSPTDKKK